MEIWATYHILTYLLIETGSLAINFVFEAILQGLQSWPVVMFLCWIELLLVYHIIAVKSALSTHELLCDPLAPLGSILELPPVDSTLEFRFNIENCGSADAEHIRSMLHLGLSWLPAVLDDLEEPKCGRRRFDAFFKEEDRSNYVRGVLSAVIKQSKKRGLLPHPHIWTPPHIVCATHTMSRRYPFTPSPWNACLAGAAGMYIPNTRYVVLCPVFFYHPTEPIGTRQQNCPQVHRNVFTTSGVHFTAYQPLVLIHELIHFYLGPASLGGHTFPREQYLLNNIVGLSADNSVHNPMNYQAYIASESHFHLRTWK